MVEGYHDRLPEMFDPSMQEGTGFDPMPVGWYPAHVVEVEVRDAANGNGSYLFAVFEITEGDYKSRKVFQNITLTNESQQAVEIGRRLLKDVYTACGVTGPTQDIDVLLYKPVKIRIGIKRDPDGVYPDNNRVNAVRPYDYEPKRGRVAPTASAATPVSPVSSTPSSTAPKGDRPWDQKQT
jgi:hypothetical protein